MFCIFAGIMSRSLGIRIPLPRDAEGKTAKLTHLDVDRLEANRTPAEVQEVNAGKEGAQPESVVLGSRLRGVEATHS
jgi:hypothetical protein